MSANSKWRYMHKLRNPLKSPSDSKPDAKPKQPVPADRCPFCSQPVKRSSKVLEGNVVLYCIPCKRMAVRGALKSEWYDENLPDLLNRLKHVAQQIKIHEAMTQSSITDPRWSQ